MSLIYIVEDDKNIQEIESYALKSSGYDVRAFFDAASFDDAIKESLPDLLILDIMLPMEGGLSVLKRLRESSDTAQLPIIMVTAKDSEIDVVKGLDIGADDYISKPFGIMELTSRVKAVLRRAGNAALEESYRFKDIELDDKKGICRVCGKKIKLTYKEYQLLKLFLSNVGIVLSRDRIIEDVWKSDFEGETRTIDMHVMSLRKKLGKSGNCISTVRNIGYRME